MIAPFACWVTVQENAISIFRKGIAKNAALANGSLQRIVQVDFAECIATVIADGHGAVVLAVIGTHGLENTTVG